MKLSKLGSVIFVAALLSSCGRYARIDTKAKVAELAYEHPARQNHVLVVPSEFTLPEPKQQKTDATEQIRARKIEAEENKSEQKFLHEVEKMLTKD